MHNIFINDKWRKYAGDDIRRLELRFWPKRKAKSIFTRRLLCPNLPPTWALPPWQFLFLNRFLKNLLLWNQSNLSLARIRFNWVFYPPWINWIGSFILCTTCIVFLLHVYQALKMYTSSFILLVYFILYSLNNVHWCRWYVHVKKKSWEGVLSRIPVKINRLSHYYCRILEVGGTLMSPHTTDFNTLGSSWYAFCALQIWNTHFSSPDL